jgi:hypothetical protein
LAHGADAVIERGARAFPAESIAEMRARPGFRDASTGLLNGIVTLHRSNPAQHRLFSDRGRVFVAFFCLYLHGSPNESGTRLTMSRLEAACLQHEICSPARARSIVQLLLRARYLTMAEHAEDGRTKPMEPTAPLRDYFRERWAINLAALAVVRPAFEAIASALDRHGFRDALCALIGHSHQTGGGLPGEPDGLYEIAELDSGIMIMLRLALANRLGDPPPSANGMSREFGISRAHVSNILQAAERAGLIARVGATGTFAIRAPLCERMSDYCAATMLLYEGLVPEALALEGGPPPAA